ncbi:hypothetical protein [Desulfosediminicola ganghwensis]|uniref:Nmad2 family putative nucleotide modification protein n=1 Tax=Desulfosediminicola ganghwensis TaxID=2569540 RepID=UPI0010AD06B2|nr:hypothetical protein [Desulfosediminicola ganghwensis]
MNLFTYIVKHDTGLAPNPFWDYCTLSCCTPNRQGSRVEVDDLVAGFSPKSDGHKLIYAMYTSEVMGLDEYFEDKRFNPKKSIANGDWKQRCGDNFYSRINGNWIQHWNRFHIGEEYLKKDTRKPKVFRLFDVSCGFRICPLC